MKPYIDLKLNRTTVVVHAGPMGEFLRAAFGAEGACRRWMLRDIGGDHRASDSEFRKHNALAARLDINSCWLLLVLKGSRHYVHYEINGFTFSPAFDRMTLCVGMERYCLAHPSVNVVHRLNNGFTPQAVDEIVQLGLLGRVLFPWE